MNILDFVAMNSDMFREPAADATPVATLQQSMDAPTSPAAAGASSQGAVSQGSTQEVAETPEGA
jgi:hypothetical protein